MNFLNPILLYSGLACLAVPIIVHLLTRRRRTPIAWGAMRFLMEAYKKHRRRLTLEQLLLLACRCLLVALIALALGKPIVAGLAAGSAGPRTLYLVIDNSLMSSLVAADGSSALERHKAGAAKLLGKLDSLRGDRAAVVALGAPADALVVPPSSDLNAVGRVVSSLEATDGRADLDGAITRLAADLSMGEASAGVTIAVLSEWRAGSADVDRPLPTLSSSVPAGGSIPAMIASAPAEQAVDNISVTSVEPLRPVLIARRAPEGAASEESEANPVRAVLTRRGPGVGAAAATKLGVRVDMIGSGVTRGTPAESVVRWSPGQERASVTVSVPVAELRPGSGTPVVVAEIDRDALGSDNVRRRPIESRPWLAVGLGATPSVERPVSIDRFTPSDWLRLSVAPDRAASANAPLRVLDVEPRSIGAGGSLTGLDALLIPSPDRLDEAGWRRVGEFARSGGLVMVFAPSDGGVHLWADGFLSATGVGWSIARETRAYAPAAELSDAPGTSDLLALISGEVAELARPVRVSRIVPVEPGSGTADVLLRLRDGTPLVLAAPPRNGEAQPGTPSRGLIVLFACACDLGWTDLPTKPLMVPLMQEVLRQGIGVARGVWSSDAGGVPAVPAGTVELLSAETGIAVPLTGGAPPPLRRAGTWIARDARGSSLGVVAVNANLAGADTTPRAVSQLGPWLGTVVGGAHLEWNADRSGGPAAGRVGAGSLDREERPPISAPLLAGAAIIALLELFLARRFSHATNFSSASRVPVSGGGVR